MNKRSINGEVGKFKFSYGKDLVSRTSIINHLIKKYNYKSYLEIGVRDPNKGNFNNIILKNKTGVDPNPKVSQSNIIKKTSDDFFKDLPKSSKFDIIFIDGLHLENQVDNDIYNSLNHISDNGLILLHDCNPPTEKHQIEEYDGKSPWNGTVWKSIAKLRMTEKNLKINTIDTDWGVGIIKKLVNGNNILETEKLTYNFLENNRKKVLNLISVNQFLKKF